MKTLFVSPFGFGEGLYHLDLVREYLRRTPGETISFYAKSKLLAEAARRVSFIDSVVREPDDQGADKTVEFKSAPIGFPTGLGVARATFGWDYQASPFVEFTANKKRWDRYRQRLDLPASFVVLSPFASPEREWPAIRWKLLVDRLAFKALVIQPLEGAQRTQDFGDAQVLSGLNFLQACEVLARAKYFIGLESGLTLLAHMLNPRLLQIVQKREGGISDSLVHLGAPPEQVFETENLSHLPVEPVAERVGDLLGSHRVTNIEQAPQPPKVSVIMPVKDTLEITYQALQHLNRHTPKELYEVILIDNGSTKEGAEKLQQIKGITLIRNEENLGFSKAINQGMRAAKGRYFLFLNSDVMVFPGWLEDMVRAMEADPTVGIVGPHTNFAAGAQRMPHQGEPAQMAAQVRVHNAGQVQTVPFVTYFCTLVRRELAEKIAEQPWPGRGCDDGFLPEIYFAGAEDLHYCLEAHMVGYRSVIARSVWVLHIGHQTFLQEGFENKGEGDIYTAYWEEQTGQPVKCLLDAYRNLGVIDTKNQLAVCAIVKDEASQIMEFCDNIRSLGADEVVIADTGSTDGTWEYLQKWFEGDGFWRPRGKLLKLEWKDSFAEAHNECAEKATSDWVFFLDADERFDPVQTPRLRAALDQDEVDAWRPTLVSFNDDPYEVENPDAGLLRQIRLYRNGRGVTWRFRVDEMVDYSVWEHNLVDQVAPIEIHHFGALESEKGWNREDYARLWEMTVEEKPDAYQHWFHLGRYYSTEDRDPERALVCFEMAVKNFDAVHDRAEKLQSYQAELSAQRDRMGKPSQQLPPEASQANEGDA